MHLSTRRRRTLLVLLIAVISLLAATSAHASGIDQTVALQADVAHDGDITGFPLTGTLTQVWSDTFINSISSPLVVDGVVYLSVQGSPDTLQALDAGTGAKLWTTSLGNSNDGIAYDAGQIFAIGNGGLLTAYDAASGVVAWSVQLPDQYAFSSPPTATDGLVFVSGAGFGGTVYAVRQSDGELIWADEVQNGDDSSPAISGSQLYVSYACRQAYDLDVFSGAPIWYDDTSCEGGGGATVAVADGNVFARDDVLGSAVLSATDGSVEGPFSAGPIPAIGDGMAFELDNGTLSAVSDSGTGTTAWTFTGDGGLVTAPLIVGTLVFVGSNSGQLYALNAATGAVEWSTLVGGADAVALDGLAAAGGLLGVEAGDTFTVYAPSASLAATPVNESAPTVGGPVRAAAPVAADAGAWTGAPTGYGYQWMLCDATGTGCSGLTGPAAAAAVYTPTSAQIGSTLKVEVTASNASGSQTQTSAASAVIAESTPLDQTAPTISGNAVVGATLTADPGSWSPSPVSFDYQWLRCDGGCLEISGATGSTYTTTPSDVEDELLVVVTPVDAAGESPGAYSAATAEIVSPAPPTSESAPTISGGAGYPGTLTATTGTWSQNPTSYGYEWFDCQPGANACTLITGATGSSYALTQADVGHTIEVGVVAANQFGSSSQSLSTPTAAVASLLPVVETAPSFSGALVVGQTLTASPGVWSQAPTGYAYQWMRCTVGTTTCTPINGATGYTYVPAAADVGSSLAVQVVASNARGSSLPAQSAIAGPVSAPATATATPATTTTTTEKTVAKVVFTERLTRQTLATVLTHGYRVTLRCAKLCAADLRLTAPVGSGRRTVVIGTLRAALPGEVSRTVVIKLTPAMVRAIRKERLKRLVVTLSTGLSGAPNARSSSTHTLTLGT